MRLMMAFVLTLALGFATLLHLPAQQIQAQPIDLAELLSTGKLRAVNRAATKLQGNLAGVHVDERTGPGVVWIEGTNFAEGTIELDVRGRDLPQRSFVGIAFHRKDDSSYEAVYVRPFNFHADNPVSHKHAVQYMAPPDYDWPRLRQEFPGEFESAVDPSVSPGDWVHLQVVVKGAAVEVYVGGAKSPNLQVRKLGQSTTGLVGLWTGNNSDGDFSGLKIVNEN